MSPETELGCVVTVMFFAALTRSTFGFGEALVAVPLLSLILKVETASALVAISSVCNSLIIVGTARQATDWRGAGRLVLAVLAGIPVGVYVLTHVPEHLVKQLLAAVVISFALFSLSRHGRWQLKADFWAYPFGFLSGVLGGAYNISGPPLVIFGTLRGWPPEQFRATLQGVFLVSSSFVLLSHYSAGLWSAEVMRYLWWILPALVVTVPLGHWLNRRIHPEHFQRWLFGLLVALGILLVWSTI